MRVELLIIDPQFDFCNPKGSLFVTGADEDSKRLAKMIKRLKGKIDDIHVTLDTHHRIDIAHPIFWVDAKRKNHPAPFTVITEDDVLNCKWVPTNPSYYSRETMRKAGWDRDGVKEYVTTLKSNGRYVLCIWPEHCLIGSPGHNVESSIFEALCDWESQFAMVDYVTKGSNFLTENYSAVRAEVEDDNDPTTKLNANLIKTLEEADIIGLAGEALDFCLANTARDIVNEFGKDNIKKIVLLTNGTSPVNAPGLEFLAPNFIKDMKALGMQMCTCEEFLA